MERSPVPGGALDEEKTMTDRILTIVPCLAVLLACFPGRAGAEIVRFEDGSFLQGELLESDKAGFTLKRWDTGGLVKFTWEQIAPDDRTRLRRALGLEFSERERGVTVEGVRVHLKAGEVFECVVLEDTPKSLRIRRSTGEFKYPKDVVKRTEPVALDVLSIYTEEEAYQNKIAKDGAPKTADENYETASWCRRIGYFEKEKEHLLQVQTLAPDFQPDYIRNRLESLSGLVQESQVRRAIKDVLRLAARKKFTEAQAAWEAVRSSNPDVPLVANDTEDVAGKIEQAKTRYLGEVVVPDWFTFLRSIVNKKAFEKELKLADAKKWVQKDLPVEILAAVAKKRGLPETEIKNTFAERKVYNVRTADYTTGTFIVEKSAASGSSGMSGLIDDLGKRLGLDQGTRDKVKGAFGQQSSGSADKKKALTPDDWWALATVDMKTQWMTAYYAENAGDMTVVRTEKKPCPNCAGLGYITTHAAGGDQDGGAGGAQHAMCPRCQGLGHDKIVVFK
jgi:hypothetical protein